ncbi:riboflavin synthase [Sphingosinicella ginsenosidimutans]|uniref:Riboflavin synthase n=1 Tax=Allosphingosinicella ginsenosidimutans TaxID=1176539 RepID=A0A5C6TUE9_9SPHN|nr:riboflavin synthase [Sphingosinicella ginsenosidimutans]TXC63308.1 riboflavin synthase [Sphingosinicella ginsenosidimutans]
MFTGIVTDIGRIEAVEQRGDLRARIASGYDMAGVDLGASIACSGVCLTVVDKGAGWFAVDVSAETQARTRPGLWTAGARLNLERALKVGDELGGHIVTGHVDGIGTIEAVEPVGDSTRIAVAVGPELAPYLAAKGSIALDGVSLTVNDVADRPGGGALFSINLIPHTRAQTTFDDLAVGRALNVEIDILARYLGRMLAARNSVV